MKNRVQASLYIPPELADRISEFRFSNKIDSKNDAYIKLLELALDCQKTLNN